MLTNPGVFNYHLHNFYKDKVQERKSCIAASIDEIARIVFDVLKEVEIQEPRFISLLNEHNGRYEGISVVAPNEYEVVLFLNQMGVFNFVDDNTAPGCALLKLSDGRKRSMSLWVEFITASGYLSARKIRARFHSLVSQACAKCSSRELVRLMANGEGANASPAANGCTEVKLIIRETYVVNVVPAFKCANAWPRSASRWPWVKQWPCEALANSVKSEGFYLLSKESLASKEKQQQHHMQQQLQQQQQQQQQPQSSGNNSSSSSSGSSGSSCSSSSEGDSWVISFADAEDKLLAGGIRRKCLAILKAMRDKYLDVAGQPITNYVMKTLLLYECEKHPNEAEWEESALADRLNGIMLQLVACLRSRRCPAYFMQQVDIFRGKDVRCLDYASRQAWSLQRQLILNSTFFNEI